MNHSQAQYILEECYEEALSFQSNPKAQFDQYIDIVLTSSNQTLKYMLFIQLLAKATNSGIAPLSFQKKDHLVDIYGLQRLYDEVIVPFEKNILHKKVNGSNGSIQFSKSNFSQKLKKKDKEQLDLLDQSLSELTSDEAYRELVYFLSQLIQPKERNRDISKSSNVSFQLFDFIMSFLQESDDEEALFLVVAGIYDLMYSKFSTIKTEIHEGISDLDVFQNGILKFTNVLQDGPYSEIDVRQAAYKAIKAGSDQMFFIQGIHGKSKDYSWILKLTDYYLSLGLLLDITSIESFARMRLMLIPNPDAQRFVDYIRKLAQEEKFKSETIERIDALAYDILEMHQ